MNRTTGTGDNSFLQPSLPNEAPRSLSSVAPRLASMWPDLSVPDDPPTGGWPVRLLELPADRSVGSDQACAFHRQPDWWTGCSLYLVCHIYGLLWQLEEVVDPWYLFSLWCNIPSISKSNRLLDLGLSINIYTPIRIVSSRQLLLILHLCNKPLVPREAPI